MRFAPKNDRPGLDIFWYDGGIKPPVPDELMAENKELAEEGMMFVGDKGKILGGFHAEGSRLLGKSSTQPEAPSRESGAGRQRGGQAGREAGWISAFKGGPRSYGDFLLAGPISEAINLAAISLRLGGRRLLWDSAAAKITNVPEANRFLTREYRPGWQI